MKKKVVIVTGSSAGVGFYTAQLFHQKGCKVYGFSRSKKPEASFEQISVDLTNFEELRETMDRIIQTEKQVDILINNAGRGMVGAISDNTPSELQDLFALNIIALQQMMASVLPTMRSQKKGKIINVSSIASEMGLPFRGAYSATKSAVDRITEAARIEEKNFGIEICSLHLGDIATRIDKGRIYSTPSEAQKFNHQKVLDTINAHMHKGTPPEKVAEFIYRLSQKKSFPPHIYYGKTLQKLSVFLKKILPQRTFENIIRKYTGL